MATAAVTKQQSPPTDPHALTRAIAARCNVPVSEVQPLLMATVFNQGKGEPLSQNEFVAALIICEAYGLNPFLREIYCFRHQGTLQTPVGVDGWIRILNSQPSYLNVSFSYEDGEEGKPYSCTCLLRDKERGEIPVTEYFAECVRRTPAWEQMPRRMLRHRALIQAIRIAYGIGGLIDEDEFEGMRDVEAKVRPVPDARPKLESQPAKAIPLDDKSDPSTDKAWRDWVGIKGQVADFLDQIHHEVGVEKITPEIGAEKLAKALAFAREVTGGGK